MMSGENAPSQAAWWFAYVPQTGRLGRAHFRYIFVALSTWRRHNPVIPCPYPECMGYTNHPRARGKVR